MKERKFKIGDLEVIQSNMGLDFRTKDGSHLWLNVKGQEELVKLITMSDTQYDSYIIRNERKSKLDKLCLKK